MKQLCKVSDHPELKKMWEETLVIEADLLKRAEEIASLKKQLLKDTNQIGKDIWTRTENYLKDNNLLPADYSKENDSLNYDGHAITSKSIQELKAERFAEALVNLIK